VGETTEVYLNGTEYHVQLPSGTSGVIPAGKIAELLNGRKFQMQRDKIDNLRIDRSEMGIEHTGAGRSDATKRKNREVEIPPMSRKKFFGDTGTGH
jgi:hypothetical protein